MAHRDPSLLHLKQSLQFGILQQLQSSETYLTAMVDEYFSQRLMHQELKIVCFSLAFHC